MRCLFPRMSLTVCVLVIYWEKMTNLWAIYINFLETLNVFQSLSIINAMQASTFFEAVQHCALTLWKRQDV